METLFGSVACLVIEAAHGVVPLHLLSGEREGVAAWWQDVQLDGDFNASVTRTPLGSRQNDIAGVC